MEKQQKAAQKPAESSTRRVFARLGKDFVKASEMRAKAHDFCEVANDYLKAIEEMELPAPSHEPQEFYNTFKPEDSIRKYYIQIMRQRYELDTIKNPYLRQLAEQDINDKYKPVYLDKLPAFDTLPSGTIKTMQDEDGRTIFTYDTDTIAEASTIEIITPEGNAIYTAMSEVCKILNQAFEGKAPKNFSDKYLHFEDGKFSASQLVNYDIEAIHIKID